MTLTVFGGDERSVAAAKCFSDAGFDTSVFALENAELPHSVRICEDPFSSDVIVFSLPFCAPDGQINCPLSSNCYSVVDVFSRIHAATTVFCGAANSFAKAAAAENNIDLNDYFDRDDIQIKNSVPTAEGALFEFMKRKKVTVFGSECAVTGYGKIGMRVADRLNALGARVTVAARGESDLARAESNGLKAVRLDEFIMNGFVGDCIFNTVPCNIFSEEFTRKTGDDTLYIELASKPYGMDEKCVKTLGERHVFANSLPGKYAPRSAGAIIAETVCKYITSRRNI